MAWYTARILICLITNPFIRENSTPYYYANNRPSEQDSRIQNRQNQHSEDPCSTVPQLHAWAISKRGNHRAAELCEILGGRCPNFVGTLSSTTLTESSTGVHYSTPARTAHSAADKTLTSPLLQLIGRSANSSLATASSVSARSGPRIPQVSLLSIVTSISSRVKGFLPWAVAFGFFTSSTSSRVTDSQLIPPSHLDSVPIILAVSVSTVVITEFSTVSKDGIALPPTTLLLTSTLTAATASTSRSVASSIKRVYPLNTGPTARPTKSTAEDVSGEEALRHGTGKMAVAVASAGGGSSFVLVILALVRRYWRQYKGKTAIQEECQDYIPTHGNIGSSAVDTSDEPDDDTADCSFETQDLNQIATERENHAAAVGRVGAYRAGPLRDRHINTLASARRLMGLEHLAPRSTGRGTSIINEENVTSSSPRLFEESAIVPLHILAATNRRRDPIPHPYFIYHPRRPRRDPIAPWRPVPSYLPPHLFPQELKIQEKRLLNKVTTSLEAIEEENYVRHVLTESSSDENEQVTSSADRNVGEVLHSLASERK